MDAVTGNRRAGKPGRNPADRAGSGRQVERVLFAAAEVYPLIMTGGLAEVACFLPAALKARSLDVRILLPAYGDVLAKELPVERETRLRIPDTGEECALLQIRLPALRKLRRKSRALRKRLDELYNGYIVDPLTNLSREGLWKAFDLGFVEVVVFAFGLEQRGPLPAADSLPVENPAGRPGIEPREHDQPPPWLQVVHGPQPGRGSDCREDERRHLRARCQAQTRGDHSHRCRHGGSSTSRADRLRRGAGLRRAAHRRCRTARRRNRLWPPMIGLRS